jgi:hypothetical protein
MLYYWISEISLYIYLLYLLLSFHVENNPDHELRKNLIPFGVLDSDGYRCKNQGGVLKVSKGILVFMK